MASIKEVLEHYDSPIVLDKNGDKEVNDKVLNDAIILNNDDKKFTLEYNDSECKIILIVEYLSNVSILEYDENRSLVGGHSYVGDMEERFC
ncbi:hypothetical protein BGI41_07875 [Methanobrevibacter sp. 87.7]|uniref:hypothetical protein n=1 Tax=Methanobrevibacter sp. 87.7 TaxID=387957 RepID=UPI000B511DDD|nr:hypothetical protein [Methanobrevibacter sp. 87.7]OWT32398.1 hypothetical protein BGI41_07875 [Methanobrevibacter sp. 87.7]